VRVYLDHNATAPVRSEAIQTVADALRAGGNASSVHAAGRAARASMERARAAIARHVCARAEDLIFTSGGSEANTLAIHAARQLGVQRIIISAIEHEAVRAAAQASGLPVEIWPVDTRGRVDLSWLETRLNDSGNEVVLIALMAANNETGVIQPYEVAGRLIREAGHYFHIDAVQMTGKADFDFAGSLAHFAALSSHKAGGPQGVGALIAACDAQVAPLIHGGGQEKNRRGGTENVAGICGFAAAVEAAAADAGEADRQRALRDRLEQTLKAQAPEVVIWGAEAERLPNTTCLSALGWPSEIQVIAMDLEGFEVSAGSACSSGKVRKSAVLDAMGAGEEHAKTALRISLGWTTTQDDVDRFAKAWLSNYERARPKAAATA
jgi:cysteine desulfurase